MNTKGHPLHPLEKCSPQAHVYKRIHRLYI